MGSPYQTPDLATILRTLAGHTQAQSSQSSPTNQSTGYPDQFSTFQTLSYAQNSHVQSQIPVSDSGTSSTAIVGTSTKPVQASNSRPPELASAPKPNSDIDPTTITTWSPALRYVTKLLSQNEQLVQHIKKLIKSQHDHERQWWKGRDSVIQERRKREESRNAINDVLRAIGGLVDTSAPDEPDSDEAALAAYDRKVHQAMHQMFKSFNKDLTEMGIPFFGTKSHLIREDGTPDTGTVPTMTRKELGQLQRRMLQFLEDMCKD
jgi:hypothetical protein